MTISTKRVLITGGCGFIGTNLSAHYIDRGWEVTAFDNLSRLGPPLNAAADPCQRVQQSEELFA